MTTRFPEKRIDIIHAGQDGETSRSMLYRYQNDILDKGATEAFVMFGTNDANYGLYPDGLAANKAASIESAVENIGGLINKLQGDGIENITLMTTPTYDERAYSSATTHTGFAAATTTLSDRLKNIATEEGLKIVDVNSATAAITEAVYDSIEEEIYQPDRIHPNKRGHFVIANEIIKTLYADYGLVASVEVDKTAESIDAENANVGDLVIDGNTVTYTYNPKSIPMGVDSKVTTASSYHSGYAEAEARYPEFVNFTDTMNREIIKVTGLTAGDYDVSFDDIVIGTFTANELAEGVNIAILANNPGQIKAKAIVDAEFNLYWTKSRIRSVERGIATLKDNNMYYGKTFAEMKAWIEENYKNTSSWDGFLTYFTEYDNYVESMKNCQKNNYVLAKPGTYTVKVTPAV